MEYLKEIVSENGHLRGVIHKSLTNINKGIVVIIHGYFSSTKLGPARLYVQISRIFANYGYEVWRFDNFGVGDSDGVFTSSTPETRLMDFQTIIKKAMKQTKNTILLGHSLGSNLAVRLSETTNISCLILLSPSIGKITWKNKLLTEKQIEELEIYGKTIRKALEIKQEFIHFLEDENVYNICKKYKSKTILMYGLKDEFYTSNAIEKIKKLFSNSTLINIEGGDHNFINNMSRKLLLEEIKNACQQCI